MKTFDEIRRNSLTEASATAGDHEDAAHAHRTASKQPKMDLKAVKAHEKAAEHHDTAAKHLKTGNAYAAQNAHINAKNEADKAKDYGNVHSKRAHADTRAIGEGYASAAQRKAIWANKADGGKGHPDNKKKKEDVDEVKSADKKPEKYTDANGKVKIRMVPVVKEQDEVNELDTSTLVSYRKKANKQRYSNNISKRTQRTAGVDAADKKLRKRNIDKFGKHSPKGVDKMGNPKEDSSDAVKAFLAKGGKIKKLPPAKAQGYHGKDDPGKDVHGVMDKPDTKRMGTRKKVKSMEAMIPTDKGPFGIQPKAAVKVIKKGKEVKEISRDTKKNYIKKAADDMSKQADKMARAQRGDGKMDKAVNKFVNRRKGIARAVEAKETDPPFNDAKKISTTPAKDQFGNIIKNRAKHLARQAAKKAGGDMGDKK